MYQEVSLLWGKHFHTLTQMILSIQSFESSNHYCIRYTSPSDQPPYANPTSSHTHFQIPLTSSNPILFPSPPSLSPVIFFFHSPFSPFQRVVLKLYRPSNDKEDTFTPAWAIMGPASLTLQGDKTLESFLESDVQV